MIFKKGNFIYLKDGQILEIVYADDEKAVCLKIQRSGGKCFYTGKALVLSNDDSFHKDDEIFEFGPAPDINGNMKWEPLKMLKSYNIN